jgi:hypothetical protein
MSHTVMLMLPHNRANSVEDAMRRGQRQVEQAKIKMGKQMDDKTFQATLLETNVRAYFLSHLMHKTEIHQKIR